MDQNEALGLLREWANGLINDPSYRTRRELDAAQAFRDLDGYLSRGGFIPDAWAKAQLD